MTMKLEQWQILPWLLCMPGHLSEDVARAGAKNILAQYDRCSPEAANHRLTNMFCSADGVLARQLRSFASGAPRASTPELYTMGCKLAAIPCTERSIEQPHGAIRLAAAFKNAGPVSVAGAVRGPEAEQVVADAEQFETLSTYIDTTKHLRKFARLLGIQDHPCLRALPIGRDLQSHRLMAVLTSVIYRCDLHAQHDDLGTTTAAHVNAKRKRESTVNRAAVTTEAARPSKEAVLARLAMDHFRQVVDDERVFSVPSPQAHAIYLAPIRQHMTKQPQPVAASADSFDEMCPDIEEDEAGLAQTCMVQEDEGIEAPRVFFRVVHRALGRRKQPVAAGGSMNGDLLAVSIVNCTETALGRLRVDLSGAAGSALCDRVAFISYLHADAMWLRTALLQHVDERSLESVIEGFPVEGVRREILHKLVDKLLASISVGPAEPSYQTECDQELQLLRDLSGHGFCSSTPTIGNSLAWRLTSQGMAKLRFDSYLGAGTPVLEPRSDLALTDQTLWELMVGPLDVGWEWRPLPCESKRRLALPFFELETQQPNVFYTGLCPSRLYLEALLQPQRLRDLGIQTVPHGQSEKTYENIMKGIEFKLVAPRPALTMDVEDDVLPRRGRGGHGRRGRRRGRGHAGVVERAALDGLVHDEDDHQLDGEAPDGHEGDGDDGDVFGGDDLVDALEEILAAEFGPPDPPPPPSPLPLEDEVCDVPLDPPPPMPPPFSPPNAAEDQPGLDLDAERPVVAVHGGELAAEDGHANRRRTGVSESWGPRGMFQFIVKRSGGTTGGWQAACPFHRGTPTAPKCRKYIPAASASEEDMQHAKVRAKAWCVAGGTYDRKYKHLRHPLPGPDDERVLDLQVWLLKHSEEEPLPDYLLDGILSPPAGRHRRGSADSPTLEAAAPSGAASSSSAAPAGASAAPPAAAVGALAAFVPAATGVGALPAMVPAAAGASSTSSSSSSSSSSDSS